ncbi:MULTISPECIES: hypothetical protein [unclassified Mycobacterium]|uniref:hypothetical protein n=1 Tax=unclassified Mycobacterium TaxID=2642494 RepID=UPI0007FF18D0|nr:MULTISPECIES: hypothetical protein [unclassified Mycobacterium]OBG70498.1 hypothetical protein A5700_14760 [Mycobacterium sp. E1214]OBH26981.1 hypothetical protein A5693_24780 [Mycobacterium sp. E1319]
MDGALMGLMGMVVGASAASAAGVARSVSDTVLPRMMGNADHRHQMSMQLHAQRCEALQRWRTGLAGARDAYQRWACGGRVGEPPNVVGDEWFEGLRPHLPTTGDTAKYRSAHEIHCDNQTLTLLSLEIGRLEQDWTEEVRGRRRRDRRG